MQNIKAGCNYNSSYKHVVMYQGLFADGIYKALNFSLTRPSNI